MSEKTLFDFSAKDITGQEVLLSTYKGKVTLVVNVASQCGLTPQYEGLEALYQKYHSQGLEILGFPCNQFGSQEPGTESEIKTFCSTHFSVTFPLFSKIDVNGSNTHPVFEFLKSEKKGFLGTELIKWNFTKFLVAKDGSVLKRFAPQDEPKTMEIDIEKALVS